MEKFLTEKEKAKLKLNFGFSPVEIEEAEKFLGTLKHNSYYRLGALMAIVSQRIQRANGLTISHKPTGKIRAALNERYGETLGRPNWGDHARFVERPGDLPQECRLLCSPYGLDFEDLKDLIEFCSQYDFDCRIAGIDGESYFPGHTVDIWVTPKGKQAITKPASEG
jgi:hypothetical protein